MPWSALLKVKEVRQLHKHLRNQERKQEEQQPGHYMRPVGPWNKQSVLKERWASLNKNERLPMVVARRRCLQDTDNGFKACRTLLNSPEGNRFFQADCAAADDRDGDCYPAKRQPVARGEKAAGPAEGAAAPSEVDRMEREEDSTRLEREEDEREEDFNPLEGDDAEPSEYGDDAPESGADPASALRVYAGLSQDARFNALRQLDGKFEQIIKHYAAAPSSEEDEVDTWYAKNKDDVQNSMQMCNPLSAGQRWVAEKVDLTLTRRESELYELEVSRDADVVDEVETEGSAAKKLAALLEKADYQHAAASKERKAQRFGQLLMIEPTTLVELEEAIGPDDGTVLTTTLDKLAEVHLPMGVVLSSSSSADGGTMFREYRTVRHVPKLNPFAYQVALACKSRDHRNTLVVSSTGSGKTVMYLYLLRYWLAADPKAVFLVLVQTAKSVEVEMKKLLTQADFFEEALFVRKKTVHAVTSSNWEGSLRPGHVYFVSSANTTPDLLQNADAALYFVVDEVHEFFDYRVKSTGDLSRAKCGQSKQACKRDWHAYFKRAHADASEPHAYTKLFALTATPLFSDDEGLAEERRAAAVEFEAFFGTTAPRSPSATSGYYYYYALANPNMPQLQSPPIPLRIETTQTTVQDRALQPTKKDFGLKYGSLRIWHCPEETVAAVLTLYDRTSRPKMLVIVDEPSTSVRLAHTLVAARADGTHRSHAQAARVLQHTKIYCGAVNRAFCVDRWYDAGSKDSQFAQQVRTLGVMREPKRRSEIDMLDGDIRSEFNKRDSDAIYIVCRHPYATGADYMGVKLLLRSPTTDLTHEVQLQGRVLRHCGFTAREIREQRPTPIAHHVFCVLFNGVAHPSYVQHEANLKVVDRQQQLFYQKSLNGASPWARPPTSL